MTCRCGPTKKFIHQPQFPAIEFECALHEVGEGTAAAGRQLRVDFLGSEVGEYVEIERRAFA